VGELIATLTGFALFLQNPVYRAQRTVINTLVQQGSEYPPASDPESVAPVRVQTAARPDRLTVLPAEAGWVCGATESEADVLSDTPSIMD
jgi:hypothetical protein